MAKLALAVPTFLYRLYDAQDELLYVGITENVRLRMQRHAAIQPWWNQVERLEVATYSSRDEAEEAELRAIRGERPKMNITGAARQSGQGRGNRSRQAERDDWFTDPVELARTLGVPIRIPGSFASEGVRRNFLALIWKQSGLAWK